MREESRGAHHREDALETRGGWQKNILCAQGEDGAMCLRATPVGEVSGEIRAALEEKHAPNYHHTTTWSSGELAETEPCL